MSTRTIWSMVIEANRKGSQGTYSVLSSEWSRKGPVDMLRKELKWWRLVSFGFVSEKASRSASITRQMVTANVVKSLNYTRA